MEVGNGRRIATRKADHLRPALTKAEAHDPPANQPASPASSRLAPRPEERADHAEARKAEGLRLTLATIEQGLEALASNLPLSTGRQAQTKLKSRAKQLADQLARIDPADVDPVTRARIDARLQALQADGAGFSLRALFAKVRSWGTGGPSPVDSPDAVRSPADAAQVKALERHVLKAAQAYGRGDYQQVHRMLTDETFARSVGISLNPRFMGLRQDPSTWSQEDLDEVVVQARIQSMSWESGKVDIIDAGMLSAERRGELRTLPEMPRLAEQLLPIMLEEWMHQLQRRTGQPVSKLSAEFCKASGIPWSSDLHEMDVQAAFREWGYPVERLGTVHAYPIRRQFEDWYQARHR